MINIRGISKLKFADLMNSEHSGNSNVICIFETHEKFQKIGISSSHEVFASRRDLEDKKGGGLLVLFNRDFVNGTEYNADSADLLHCKIQCHNLELHLILVYMDVMDQERNDEIRRELRDIIEKFADNERIMVLGDFNGHLDFLGDQSLNDNGKFVVDLIEHYNLILANCDDRCIEVTTREENGHKSVIDFIMVNSVLYDYFVEMRIDEQKEKFDLSDHCLVKMDLATDKNEEN